MCVVVDEPSQRAEQTTGRQARIAGRSRQDAPTGHPKRAGTQLAVSSWEGRRKLEGTATTGMVSTAAESVTASISAPGEAVEPAQEACLVALKPSNTWW